MKTQRERAAELRAARLLEVQGQIDAGTLVIRRMTANERAKQPARPRPKQGQETAAPAQD
jgi:hypothetical protein